MKFSWQLRESYHVTLMVLGLQEERPVGEDWTTRMETRKEVVKTAAIASKAI